MQKFGGERWPFAKQCLTHDSRFYLSPRWFVSIERKYKQKGKFDIFILTTGLDPSVFTNFADKVILSLDVTALLSSIDLKHEKKLLELLQKHHPDRLLESATICELMDLRFRTCYEFQGDIYEQIKRMPMVSEFLEELVMQNS